MSPERKRLVWILIAIGLFFANLIVVTVMVLNQGGGSRPAVRERPAGTTRTAR